VQAIVASVLGVAGYRVGQTPSPHLVTYRERITIDGAPIDAADFATLVRDVLRAEERIAGRLGHATEFELLTAAAFSWFAHAGADVGVIEVGIGGRLDATNTWDGGVAAITNIDWDHADRLGGTLTAIAGEKAAIIKRGDRAVTGATGEGLEVIRRRARTVGVPLREVAPYAVKRMDRSGLVLALPAYGELRLSLLGRHQAANAAVAIATLEELETAAIADVPNEAIRTGLAATRWPGRLELLALDGDGRATSARSDGPDPSSPDLLLDGAHNVAGVTALADAYDELRPLLSPGRATLLFGLMGDKDVAGISTALLRSELASARIIATSVGGTRALPARELVEVVRARASSSGGDASHAGDVTAADTVEEGIGAAVASARREGGPLVVAGSLYLVGDVRSRLVDDPALRDP